MRREDDFAEISEKESNLEDTLDSRLVSHPKSALSLDRIPGGSLRIVAWSLDSVVPDNAVTLPATEEPRTDRGDSKEINPPPCNTQTYTRPRPIMWTWSVAKNRR